MIYSILGIIYCVVLIAIIAVIGPPMVRMLKRGEEGNSKNLFYLVPSFVLTYALYLTASFYKKEQIDVFYCFNLISTTLNFFVFKADTALILPIAAKYSIYAVNFILTAIISSAALLFNVYTFFSQRIRNFFALRRLLKSGCDVVIGSSPDACKYAKSNPACIVWETTASKKRCADLFKEGLICLRAPLSSQEFLRRSHKKEYNFIAFRDGNHSYAQIIEAYNILAQGDCTFSLHIEASRQEMKILKEEFISKAGHANCGHIACFNRYELLARRFVTEHPLSKYIPRSFFNKNCTLKDDKEINVVFVGFGKTNYEIFRMCASQFFFATEKDGKLAAKPVNYYVYDKEPTALHNEFFSRILYEFDRDFASCDFEKPDKLCNLTVRNCNVNSVQAKEEFASLLHPSAYTAFVVSMENDLQDASYAQTVKRLAKDAPYHIFVHTQEKTAKDLVGNGSIVYFGEEDTVFHHENVVNDDLTELAQRLNLLYSNMKNAPDWLQQVAALPIEQRSDTLQACLQTGENKWYMKKQWANLPFIEQTSNLYHALNMSFKMHLLGFELAKKSTAQPVSEQDFNLVYQNTGRENGYADYSFFFDTKSANVLAFIEHLRWNALYVFSDYTQMKKADLRVVQEETEAGELVKTVPHKCAKSKQHACLTTYYGLHDLIAYKYGLLCPEKDFAAACKQSDETLRSLAKIYAYDYMDLDRLYEEITAMGYVITK